MSFQNSEPDFPLCVSPPCGGGTGGGTVSGGGGGIAGSAGNAGANGDADPCLCSDNLCQCDPCQCNPDSDECSSSYEEKAPACYVDINHSSYDCNPGDPSSECSADYSISSEEYVFAGKRLCFSGSSSVSYEPGIPYGFWGIQPGKDTWGVHFWGTTRSPHCTIILFEGTVNEDDYIEKYRWDIVLDEIPIGEPCFILSKHHFPLYE